MCLENDACISKAEGRQYERKRNAVGVWEGGKGRGPPPLTCPPKMVEVHVVAYYVYICIQCRSLKP